MNYLIDINHPGQVHLFKNLINELKRKNHNVVVTIKNIPSAIKLLNIYKIDYILLGSKSDSLIRKAFDQIIYNFRLWLILVKFKIDIALGSSITIDHACFFHTTKSLHFSDDDAGAVPLTVKFAYPFSNTIICPDCLSFEKFSNKQIQYAGYHELAYLHPNRFKPDPEVLKEVGLSENDTFFIMRFNAFKAHHDVGVQGLSLDNKRKLIKILKQHGKIFITSERELDLEFDEFRIKIPPHKIHSFLYYAKIFIGDSQTMTSEAAVLGTPAVKLNSFAGKLSIPNELEEKYGLCYSFQPNKEEKMYNKIGHLLSKKNLKKQWKHKRSIMLKDKMDVTSYITWFIENYPKSVSIVKSNPKKQRKFK